METVLSKHSAPLVLKGVQKKEEEELLGQATIWKLMLSFMDSFALKAAVELRIADIIDHHGRPISLQTILNNISDAPSPDISFLHRVMRHLVRKNIFSSQQSELNDTLYDLTPASKWLLRDSKSTLAPMILLENHPLHLDPSHYLSHSIREGTKNGSAFFKCHGHEQFDLTGLDPEFNKLFNEGMACTARIVSKAVTSGYKEGFKKIQSLVDVGGGIGGSLSGIVRAYPLIKGINFDLPHVVATAPKYDGITHVGGNMFQSIPKADAVYMKWILHDWSDQECVQILKNCRKAIPEKTGKVIIVDHVLHPQGNGIFEDTGFAFDMMLLTHNGGGKERTEEDWKKLFQQAGFLRYNIININAFPSNIIEAFPI
ncbi:(R,S)-reticuline 7-O-methyltransferase-like [Senna tora]|uniref:(R,S)-reticuline 7-O-methyltransferase-like n=1 Tax=Senna tora TaxID=362788 RepID=A0A834WXT4_9FABA|nr:(R,S)-reticuline 7-O-methyltransferase-like [Senna tora]